MRAPVIVFLAALLVQAVSQSGAGAADPYDIYVIESLTGPAAFIGKGATETFHAAETQINSTGGIHGRPVHFIIQDDETNPQVAVQLFNGIVAQHGLVEFGPTLSAQCNAIVPLVKSQIINYCLSPALHPPAGSYSFAYGASTADLVATALRYFRSRGITKLATLNTTDASGQDGDTVIKEDLTRPEFKDMQLVDVEHFGPADLSVDAQLQRIKASGAQAIISWIAGTPLGTILRGMTDASLSIPILSSAGNVSYVQMAQYKAFLPKETYLVSPGFIAVSPSDPPQVKALKKQFSEAMLAIGVAKPDGLTAGGWDPIVVVVDALRHLPEGANVQQLHAYIEQLHDFPGLGGMMDFRGGNQRGEPSDSALVVRYDGASGQFIPVSAPGGGHL